MKITIPEQNFEIDIIKLRINGVNSFPSFACEKCGKIVKKKTHNHKYCKDCSGWYNNCNSNLSLREQIVLHKKVLNEELNKKKGVYFLFNKDKELLYIGRTKDVRHRIGGHLYNNEKREPPWNIRKIKEKIRYYGLIKVNDEDERGYKEQLLISYLRPPYNKL